MKNNDYRFTASSLTFETSDTNSCLMSVSFARAGILTRFSTEFYGWNSCNAEYGVSVEWGGGGGVPALQKKSL